MSQANEIPKQEEKINKVDQQTDRLDPPKKKGQYGRFRQRLTDKWKQFVEGVMTLLPPT